VEALGDPVVLRKPPHPGDLFSPGPEGPGELFEGLQTAGLELMEEVHEQRDEPLSTRTKGAGFHAQQTRQTLLERVDGREGGMGLQVGLQPLPLVLAQTVFMPAHQRDQPPVLRSHRIELSPHHQELVVDQPDDMEPIGHDDGPREVLADHGAVRTRQVHADDPDLVLASESLEIPFQRGLGAAQDDIVDLVMLQVAQRGGEAQTPGKELFVDP